VKPYYEDEKAGIVIYHGKAEEIAPSIEGVDLLLSDPPYGMNWNTDTKRFTPGPNGHNSADGSRITEDLGAVVGDAKPFDPTPWLVYPRVILFGYNHFASRLPVGTTLVWIKRLDPAFGTFLSDAELAWMKGGHGVYCRRDTSLMAETRERRHPTQKPLSLMTWCIEKAGSDGLILDPFMGSGTTLRGAKDLGRKAIGIEIEERYCEIAAQRLAQEVLF